MSYEKIKFFDEIKIIFIEMILDYYSKSSIENKNK